MPILTWLLGILTYILVGYIYGFSREYEFNTSKTSTKKLKLPKKLARLLLWPTTFLEILNNSDRDERDASRYYQKTPVGRVTVLVFTWPMHCAGTLIMALIFCLFMVRSGAYSLMQMLLGKIFATFHYSTPKDGTNDFFASGRKQDAVVVLRAFVTHELAGQKNNLSILTTRIEQELIMADEKIAQGDLLLQNMRESDDQDVGNCLAVIGLLKARKQKKEGELALVKETKEKVAHYEQKLQRTMELLDIAKWTTEAGQEGGSREIISTISATIQACRELFDKMTQIEVKTLAGTSEISTDDLAETLVRGEEERASLFQEELRIRTAVQGISPSNAGHFKRQIVH